MMGLPDGQKGLKPFRLADEHDTLSHLYADDTQLYASCRPQDCNVIRTRLSNCIADVALSCASRRLQLNAEKTEAIWFGSRGLRI